MAIKDPTKVLTEYKGEGISDQVLPSDLPHRYPVGPLLNREKSPVRGPYPQFLANPMAYYAEVGPIDLTAGNLPVEAPLMEIRSVPLGELVEYQQGDLRLTPSSIPDLLALAPEGEYFATQVDVNLEPDQDALQMISQGAELGYPLLGFWINIPEGGEVLPEDNTVMLAPAFLSTGPSGPDEVYIDYAPSQGADFVSLLTNMGLNPELREGLYLIAFVGSTVALALTEAP